MQLHRGDSYACPICGFQSSDWAPVGVDFPVLKEKMIIGGGRRRAGCFKCDSDDRERLVYLFLKEKLRIFNQKDLRILHIAPEYSLALKMLKIDFAEYVCGDLFEPGYKYPDYVKNLDVTKLPFSDKSFDLVICNHVLEHVVEDRRAMNEIARVMDNYAKAILQVPISENSQHTYEDSRIVDPEDRTSHFGQPDHVRIYGQDYPERLQECGFSVNRINISGEYPRFGLNPKEDLYVCELLRG